METAEHGAVDEVSEEAEAETLRGQGKEQVGAMGWEDDRGQEAAPDEDTVADGQRCGPSGDQ